MGRRNCLDRGRVISKRKSTIISLWLKNAVLKRGEQEGDHASALGQLSKGHQHPAMDFSPFLVAISAPEDVWAEKGQDQNYA